MENENVNQQEKQLFLNILQELEQIPQEYLKMVFGVVQAFRQNLPSTINESKEDIENFDWEELSDEIMERRKENNQQLFNRIDNFVNE